MKKILFCLQTLARGGVERELLTILPCLPRSDYDITLLYFYESDPEITREFQNAGIHLINLDICRDYHCGTTPAILWHRVRRGRPLEALKILVLQGLQIGYTGSLQSFRALPVPEEAYDIAVAYNMHVPMTVRYVAECVQAARKYAWMHTDFTASGFSPRRIRRFLPAYDLFIGCSRQVSAEFAAAMPQYQSKTRTISNFVNTRQIREKAQAAAADWQDPPEGTALLLTIGRYEREKGYDQAILACKKLVSAGYDIRWYAIGWGSLESSLRQMIAEHGLENRFFLVGKRDNPYPWLKACTVYVQPSRFEGFGLVIAEAKALCKPMVSTDFAGAREQLVDHETGTIVPVGDADALAGAIGELLQHPSLRDRYTQNLSRQTIPWAAGQLLSIF